MAMAMLVAMAMLIGVSSVTMLGMIIVTAGMAERKNAEEGDAHDHA